MVTKKYKIRTIKDLQLAKQGLKNDIREQEKHVKEHPILKAAFAFNKKKSIASLVTSAFFIAKKTSNFGSIKKFLLANKHTRKYFVGFEIAKKLVPFALRKIGKLTKNKRSKKKIKI